MVIMTETMRAAGRHKMKIADRMAQDADMTAVKYHFAAGVKAQEGIDF